MQKSNNYKAIGRFIPHRIKDSEGDFSARKLKKKGALIEDADILIAATAIKNELVVITDNTRHFDRIDNLEVSNWLHSQ
jgi:tRNA(fMet)-specific endonuclease VapC